MAIAYGFNHKGLHLRISLQVRYHERPLAFPRKQARASEKASTLYMMLKAYFCAGAHSLTLLIT